MFETLCDRFWWGLQRRPAEPCDPRGAALRPSHRRLVLDGAATILFRGRHGGTPASWRLCRPFSSPPLSPAPAAVLRPARRVRPVPRTPSVVVAIPTKTRAQSLVGQIALPATQQPGVGTQQRERERRTRSRIRIIQQQYRGRRCTDTRWLRRLGISTTTWPEPWIATTRIRQAVLGSGDLVSTASARRPPFSTAHRHFRV